MIPARVRPRVGHAAGQNRGVRRELIDGPTREVSRFPQARAPAGQLGTTGCLVKARLRSHARRRLRAEFRRARPRGMRVSRGDDLRLDPVVVGATFPIGHRAGRTTARLPVWPTRFSKKSESFRDVQLHGPGSRMSGDAAAMKPGCARNDPWSAEPSNEAVGTEALESGVHSVSGSP